MVPGSGRNTKSEQQRQQNRLLGGVVCVTKFTPGIETWLSILLIARDIGTTAAAVLLLCFYFVV